MDTHDAARLEATLRELEQSHINPVIRSDRDRLGSILHEAYTEIGASGVVHTRDSVLDALEHEPPCQRAISGFTARLLAPGVALTSYTIDQPTEGGTKRSRRSSIWVQNAGTWQLIHHQGTPSTQS